MAPLNEVDVMVRIVRIEGEIASIHGKLDDIKLTLLEVSKSSITKNGLMLELLRHEAQCMVHHSDRKQRLVFNLPLSLFIKIVIACLGSAGIGATFLLDLIR